jgi:hypothetical protein
MPLKNQVLPHQFACFGRMIVTEHRTKNMCQNPGPRNDKYIPEIN